MTRLRWWVLAAVLVFPATSARGVNNAPNWTESEVGLPLASSYASTPVLAFDHYGTPAVSWSSVSTAGGNNSVRCSQLLGLGMWNMRELANGTGLGLRTSLTFDRAERPSVAWVNIDGSVNASFNFGAPQSIAASGANFNNPVVSLSLDLAGSLRGMYGRTTAGNLFDIGYSGGTFSSSNMTTLSGVTGILDAAMVADGRGLRQVAAWANLTAGNQGLVLASEAPGGGVWSSATFASADNVTGVDIAMDPIDGRIALAYSTFTNSGTVSKLFYSKFDGISMQTTQLATSATFRYEDVSLAFDLADDHPAIAYERRNTVSSAEELMFAYRDNASVWQLPATAIDSTISMDGFGNKPRRPSLAFDDYGTTWPAVAYVDSDGSVNVAFDPPAVPEPGTLALLLAAGALAAARPRSRRAYQHDGI
jgi:hypothetical protein